MARPEAKDVRIAELEAAVAARDARIEQLRAELAEVPLAVMPEGSGHEAVATRG
ncbi:hypothetical protein ACLESO_07720 [Pyxidicoccus sp. 3LG]